MAPTPKKVEINYPPLTLRRWRPPHKPHVPNPFKRKPITRLPIYPMCKKIPHSTLEKIWHRFKIFATNSAILPGKFSINSERYSFKIRGKQGSAACFAAIGYTVIKDITYWNQDSIATILEAGCKLFINSANFNRSVCDCATPRELKDTFFVEDKEIVLSVDEETYSGSLFKHENGPYFKDELKKIFKFVDFCVAEFDGRFMLIFKIEGSYYLFDPNDRDEAGNKVRDGYGVAAVMKIVELFRLVEHCQITLSSEDQDYMVRLWPVTIKKINKANFLPPETLKDIPTLPQKIVEPKPAATCLSARYVGKIPTKLADVPEPIRKIPPGKKIASKRMTEDVAEEIVPASNTPSITALLDPNNIMEALIPKEKPRFPSISYFQPIDSEKNGIIRGTCHQNSDKCTAFMGKQTLANAIAAIGMLRQYKSKLWFSKIVDEILLTGQTIYIESRKNFVGGGDQELTLQNMVPWFIINKHKYKAKVEEKFAIGQFGYNRNLLDLGSTLSEFFIDNNAAIIHGPLVLGVWSEDEKYYMFDPNERDERGRAIIRNITLEDNEEEVEGGFACVVWFTNIFALASLYLSNVPKGQLPDSFFISRVTIVDYTELAEPWFNFIPLTYNKWIIRGTFSQNSPQFSNMSRNSQCTAIATLAVAYSKLKKMEDWDRETIDEIVLQGDQYYNDTVTLLKEKDKFKHKYLILDECLRNYKLGDKFLTFNIQDCVYYGLLKTTSEDEVPNLKNGFSSFFEEGTSCVLTARKLSIAVWKYDDFYYYFDSHSRDEEGYRNLGGNSCIMRFSNLDEMIQTILGNFAAGADDVYNIGNVEVKIAETSASGQILPEFFTYTGISPTKAILRASTHQGDFDKFDSNADKQTVPNLLAALGMTTIFLCDRWDETVMDQILEAGNIYYTKSRAEWIAKDLENFANWENEATAKNIDLINHENIMKEFYIGFNKITVEFKDVKEGIFEPEEIQRDKKGKIIYQDNELHTILLDAINTMAEKGISGYLIDSEQISVIIWRDDEFVYLYEPRGKDPEGNCFGRDLWSAKLIITQYDEEEGMEEEEEYPEKIKPGGEGLTVAEILRKSAEMANMDDEEDEDEEEEGEEEPVREVDISDAKAYCLKFTNAEDVYNHVIDNVRPNKRTETLKLIPVVLNSSPSIREVSNPLDRSQGNWFNFREIEKELWIIRGSMHMGYDYFPVENRGKQFGAMCLIACAYGRLYSPTKFTTYTVDGMLKHGDRLHTVVRREREKVMMANRITLQMNEEEIRDIASNLEIKASECPTQFLLGDYQVSVTVTPDAKYGDVTTVDKIKAPKAAVAKPETQVEEKKRRGSATSRRSMRSMRSIRSRKAKQKPADEEDDTPKGVDPDVKLPGIRRGFNEFLDSSGKFGILQTKNVCVAIWRLKEFYYLFDPQARGPSGLRNDNGTACLMRFTNAIKMAEHVLRNLKKGGINEYSIDNVEIKSKNAVRPAVSIPDVIPQIKQKLTVFKEIDGEKLIIRGTFHQDNAKFNLRPGAASACNAISCLAMRKIHNTETWSKPIIDDILLNAYRLYKLSASLLGYRFNEWEDTMTLDKVATEFKIGVFNINWGIIAPGIQKGILVIKDATIPSLRRALEEFFVEYDEGVIESPDLTTAIWTDKNLFYMFDPNARGTTGMAYSGGSACVLLFKHLKSMVEHFLANVPQTGHKNEFIVSPVTIVTFETKEDKKPPPPPPIRKEDILKVKQIDSLVSCEDEKHDHRKTPKKHKKSKPKSEPEVTCNKRQHILDPKKAEDPKEGTSKFKWMPNKKRPSPKDPCCCPDKNTLLPGVKLEIDDTVTMEQKKKLLREKNKSKQVKKLNHMEHRLRNELFDLGGGIFIVRAHFSQNNEKYSEFSRNKQTQANALVAIVMSKLHEPNTWTYKNIEIILDSGDVLYKDSYMKYRPKNPLLGLKNILRTFYIIHLKISTVIYRPYIFGNFHYEDVYIGLLNFFIHENSGILVVDCPASIAYAVFQKNKQFFMFDPFDRDVQGFSTNSNGCACLLRFNNVENLVERIIQNSEIDIDDPPRFSVCPVSIEKVERIS